MLPAPVPPGMMTEVIRTAALVALRERATTEADREHVTTHFYQFPDQYSITPLPSLLQQLSPAHCSVDTEADWRLLSEVIQRHPSLDFPEQAAVHAVWSLSSQSPHS
jgi:spore coat polysaccharide biosynthesis protein SpsF (cytidylyltransferase family)